MTQCKVYKIEYQSAWVSPQYFETDDMRSAIDFCEAGISQQYIVLVNGN